MTGWPLFRQLGEKGRRVRVLNKELEFFRKERKVDLQMGIDNAALTYRTFLRVSRTLCVEEKGDYLWELFQG